MSQIAKSQAESRILRTLGKIRMEKSGKWLIITEKPSVAADISKALGQFEKKSDHYESADYLITWAVGHLLELLPPEDIDPKYKRWLLQDLPIIPERFQYKPKDGQKERLESIKSLAKKAHVVGFINGCDAGREGELIFREVFDYCGQTKPTKRLWLQSMTLDAIRGEFRSLKKGEDYDALSDAARCRAESDWLIGMNATRAITRRLRPKNQKGASWSVGRVQTPTLALIVRREMEILKHRPEPYWTVEGRFSTDTHEYSGQWFDPNFKRSVQDEEDTAIREKEDRIFAESKLNEIKADLAKNKGTAKALETRKESKEIAPQLFDLTMLQREANRRFGLSASRTLQAAQRLYERYKLVTYPRTDSKYLPEDYLETVDNILKNFAGAGIDSSPSCKKILKKGLLNKDRVFNNKLISDHFAIIPTGEVPGTKLEGDDARVYDLILKRFLAAFMPHAVWAKVERITTVGAQSFRTRVQDLQEPGWREVYGLDTEEESKLPKLSEKNPTAEVPVETLGTEEQSNSTKPLPRFTEAKLLSLMEHAGKAVADEEIAEALKEKGIGTPATRAEIIENLIVKEYVGRNGKNLRATAKGMRLIDVLSRIPVEGLASVELTGEMEFDLKKMERGAKSRAEFMREMSAFTAEIVEKTRSFEYDMLYATEKPLGRCTCGKGNVVETFWAYKCDTSPQCEFIIWKEKNQRYIDRSLVADVLAKGSFGPIEFMTNAGTPYMANVIVNEKGFFLLDDAGKPIEQRSMADVEILREERLTDTFLNQPGRLLETDVAYLCEFGAPTPTAAEAEAAAATAALKKPSRAKKKVVEVEGAEAKPAKKPPKPKKRLMARMPKVLCHHPVTFEEFKSYILSGSTPPITDFKSKKGRPFAASLHLKTNVSFEFKFASRKKLLAGEEGTEVKPKAPKKAAGKAKVVKKSTAKATTPEPSNA